MMQADLDKKINRIEGQRQLLQVSACPVMIGINGLDCSGKTSLADAYHGYLTGQGLKTAVIHVDDYNDQAVQQRLYKAYADGLWNDELASDYYHHSVDYKLLRLAIETAARSDNDVILVEGVFLFKPALEDLFHLQILLQVDEDTAVKRYEARKRLVGDTRPTSVMTDIWIPAYQRYIQNINLDKLIVLD